MAKRKILRYSEKAFEKEKLKVLKLLEEVTLFEDTDDSATRKAQCEDDFWKFTYTYLPHYFSASEQAEWHDDMLQKANTVTNKVIAIAAPRGYSKSTILSFAWILWRVLYQKTKFTALNMETEPKATMQTWRILLELLFNPRVHHDFGKIASEDSARGDWTTIVTESRPDPVRVLAFGAGMSARGLINAQFRPDTWLNDDLESRALARNPKRVAALEDVVLADNLGAMCAGEWRFIIIGTVICRGSLLDNALSNEAFVRLKYRAIENMGLPGERSTWPALHPLPNLYAILSAMGQTRFMAEKQNEPQEVEGKFKETWFGFVKELPRGFDHSRLIDQVDPSFSEGGDNKAMLIGGVYNHTQAAADFGTWKFTDGQTVPPGQYKIMMRPFNRKCSIDDMILALYARYKLYRPSVIKMDGSFSQKITFRREFQHYEISRGALPVKFTDQARNKEQKILDLEPYIQRRHIIFLYEDTPDMKQFIIQFTRYGETGVPDDGPDVVAELALSLEKLEKKARVTLV